MATKKKASRKGAASKATKPKASGFTPPEHLSAVNDSKPDGWWNPEVGGAVHGKLLAREAFRSGKKKGKFFYKLELLAPCEGRIAKGEEVELEAGDVLAFDEKAELRCFEDKLGAEVWFAPIEKIIVENKDGESFPKWTFEIRVGEVPEAGEDDIPF